MEPVPASCGAEVKPDMRTLSRILLPIVTTFLLAFVLLPRILSWDYVVPVVLVTVLTVAVLAGVFPRIYKGLACLRRNAAHG